MSAKRILKNVREAASLIILNKEIVKQKPDYKVLLLKRSSNATFMPNSTVFPGGIQEKIDESPYWFEFYEKLGFKDKIQNLIGKRVNDNSDCLPKELSLRITAIRETFEEIGVLFCCKTKEHNNHGFGQFYKEFDRTNWQSIIHNDPSKFFTLCQELNVVPDLWNLYNWSSWMTPSSYKKRFQTAFYLVLLETKPDLIVEKNEVQNYLWMTPPEYFTAFSESKIHLPPPQFYELSRLLNGFDLSLLRNLTLKHSDDIPFILPVQYKCTDGNVFLFPGDDMYPSDPTASKDSICLQQTVQEFRQNAKKLHRFENQNQCNSVLLLNFKLPNGNISPISSDPNKD